PVPPQAFGIRYQRHKPSDVDLLDPGGRVTKFESYNNRPAPGYRIQGFATSKRLEETTMSDTTHGKPDAVIGPVFEEKVSSSERRRAKERKLQKKGPETDGVSGKPAGSSTPPSRRSEAAPAEGVTEAQTDALPDPTELSRQMAEIAQK